MRASITCLDSLPLLAITTIPAVSSGGNRITSPKSRSSVPRMRRSSAIAR